MKWTVAICTWNGANRLAGTLDSLANMRTENLTWELLIVDNNSTDDTVATCQRFENRLPMRIVSESTQGHSASRNRAVKEAVGEFIAWTDDDVDVSVDWLAAYDIAVDEMPDVDFWGGKISPRFDFPCPGWLTNYWDVCGGVYAERDLGPEPFTIQTPEELPYGANFATRRIVQESFPFKTSFGRVGSKGVRGFDEIDVMLRMMQQGHAGVWLPQAQLEHVIPRSRVQLSYVADYFFGQGETWMERGIGICDAMQLKREIRFHRFRFWINRLFASKRWFPHLVQLSNLRGQLAALKDLG